MQGGERGGALHPASEGAGRAAAAPVARAAAHGSVLRWQGPAAGRQVCAASRRHTVQDERARAVHGRTHIAGSAAPVGVGSAAGFNHEQGSQDAARKLSVQVHLMDVLFWWR